MHFSADRCLYRRISFFLSFFFGRCCWCCWCCCVVTAERHFNDDFWLARGHDRLSLDISPVVALCRRTYRRINALWSHRCVRVRHLMRVRIHHQNQHITINCTLTLHLPFVFGTNLMWKQCLNASLWFCLLFLFWFFTPRTPHTYTRRSRLLCERVSVRCR